jgi:hypothetical protein
MRRIGSLLAAAALAFAPAVSWAQFDGGPGQRPHEGAPSFNAMRYLGHQAAPHQAACAKPLAASFTLTNVGAATTISDGVDSVIFQKTATGDTAISLATLPWGANTTAYLRLDFSTESQNNNVQAAILVRNSSSGKLFWIGPTSTGSSGGVNVNWYAQRWNSYGSFNATVTSSTVTHMLAWWKVVLTGTSVQFYTSPNGWDWPAYPQWSETLSSFLASVDQVGVMVWGSNAPTALFMSCFQFVPPT